jgi:hypothetical protein
MAIKITENASTAMHANLDVRIMQFMKGVQSGQLLKALP